MERLDISGIEVLSLLKIAVLSKLIYKFRAVVESDQMLLLLECEEY